MDPEPNEAVSRSLCPTKGEPRRKWDPFQCPDRRTLRDLVGLTQSEMEAVGNLTKETKRRSCSSVSNNINFGICARSVNSKNLHSVMSLPPFVSNLDHCDALREISEFAYKQCMLRTEMRCTVVIESLKLIIRWSQLGWEIAYLFLYDAFFALR